MIDIENGTFKNGGWGATTWTNNKASMLIGSSGTLDMWDGLTVVVDALSGNGTVTANPGTSNATQTISIGVSNGSGSFSGGPQERRPHGRFDEERHRQ